MRKKAVGWLLFAALAVPGISFAQTQNVASLQAELQQLLAQVAALQAQIATVQGGGAAWCHTFNANLSIGMTGSEVTALQTALQKDGESVQITGMFDDQTASAVTGFQEKYANTVLAPLGLAHGTGYAGNATRAKLNSLFGCGTAISSSATTPVPTPTPAPTPTPTPPASSQSIPVITGVTSAGAVPTPGSNEFLIGTNLPTSDATIVIDAGSARAQTIMPIGYNIGDGGNMTFYLPSNVSVGPHTIEVQADGATSNQYAFTVVGSSLNATLSSVNSPGLLAPGYHAFITGTNLPVSGATIVLNDGSASAVMVTSYTYNNPTSISFTIPSNITLGTHTLAIQTSNGMTNAVDFTIVQRAMTITQVTSPGNIAPGYGAFVTGSNLPASDATIVIDDGSAISQTVTPTSYNGGISLGFVIPSGTLTGSHSIVVKANGATSNLITFMVESNLTASVNSVTSPGLLSPGYNAFVNGSNLPTSGATIVIDGGSVSALITAPISYNNPSSITFTIPSNITLGTHTLAIQTSNGMTNAVDFTVSGGPPTATISAGPSVIMQGQSVTVAWQSTGTTSCTLSGTDGYNDNGPWSQSGLATSGSNVVTPYPSSQTDYTAQYQITCSGPKGNSSPATATVAVNVKG